MNNFEKQIFLQYYNTLPYRYTYYKGYKINFIVHNLLINKTFISFRQFTKNNTIDIKEVTYLLLPMSIKYGF